MEKNMKFARYENSGNISYGIVDDGNILEIDSNPILGDYNKTGKTISESEVKILCPNPNPSKSLCMALNFGSHLGERGAPTRPEPFYKNTNALIGPGDPIKLPSGAGLVACESELVAIIGKETKNVSEDKALDYVFGYTCGNDVSAREWQGGDDPDIQWWRAKSADTFGPLGPYIVTGIDPQNLGIKGYVNGVEGQSCHTSEMLFPTATAISFISKYVTLYPGDMLWTGTSGKTPPINPGDTVTIKIENVGTLENPVEAA
jgi:2-keto-4-pentenoate hydratase/2-oxohepta-3-ene-1,7-dioic acid hydratase in catechol pathway